MNERYVLGLSDPEAGLERVGGKGASLSRLANAGLPVPGGFHVTTAAYRAFVSANGLGPAIQATVRQADPLVPKTLEAASRTIADLFARGTVPAEVAAAVRAAYAALG